MISSLHKKNTFFASNKDVFWNAVGSCSYAAASFLLAFVAMRFAGPDEGGIFSFGYSTLGQHIFTIAYFGTRAFQVTDTKFEYSYKLYKKHRILTSLSAIAAAFLFVLVMLLTGQYQKEKAVLVFLIAMLKVCDGYADLYESECQRMGKLWLAGKEMFIRTCLMVLIFSGVLIFGKSLFVASLTALSCQVLTIVIFNISIRKDLKAFEHNHKDNSVRLRDLFDETKEIFLVVFLDFYILSAVKYAIDLKMGDAVSGIFNILFMPTSIIYLISTMMIRPYLTEMGNAVNEKDKAAFDGLLRKITLFIIGASAICILGSFVLGHFGLTLIERIVGEQYTGRLSVFTKELVVIIAGGGLYAFSSLYYYALVAFRKQNALFLIYLIVAVIAFFIANPSVSLFGVMGAAVCYSILMLILTLLCFVTSQISRRKVFK